MCFWGESVYHWPKEKHYGHYDKALRNFKIIEIEKDVDSNGSF